MSGRGRGINNAPAWMTNRGMDGEPKRLRSSSVDRDSFGRIRGYGSPPRGLPPRRDGRSSRDEPRRDEPRRDEPRRDEPRRDEPRRDDRLREDFRHDRRGPPPPDHRRTMMTTTTMRGSASGSGIGPQSHQYPHKPSNSDRGRDYRHNDQRFDHRTPPPPSRRPPARNSSAFSSLDEELAWVEQRRRNRLVRASLFDVPPTPEQVIQDAQAATMTNFAATDFSGSQTSMPQQTRHARRLYVGNLPTGMSEDELHSLFREAIQHAALDTLTEDPILSVYINQERRFCFLEFKTVEMTTACMALDGIDLAQKGKVKIKRPNDYNPAMAPEVHPTALPKLDVSRLGIICGTVPDGSNKIFVGGLHYHLLESQILELLGAFGKVKAFHLVKSDPDSETSKGYCFVEYLDENLTQVAVAGLNGFDLGGGKVLTARIANAKDNEMTPMPAIVAGTKGLPLGVYNVEELVDAAMGLRPMPTAPSLMGMPAIPLTPSTSILPILIPTMAAAAAVLPPIVPPTMSAMDIANLLEAATGTGAPKTRILVLLNMVTDEDLQTAQNHKELSDEVNEECARYGTLLSMKIPRPTVRCIMNCPSNDIVGPRNTQHPHKYMPSTSIYRMDTIHLPPERSSWNMRRCTMPTVLSENFQGVNSDQTWFKQTSFRKKTTGQTG